MLPKIILHNSISVDGSLVDFDVNMGLHYRIAGDYKPDGHLIGSNTVKTGIEMEGGIPPEDSNDFNKPDRDAALPYWVIPDTSGKLMNLLHGLRRFEFCRDVVVLISKSTPQDYITYLEKRDYDHHVVGEGYIDINRGLELLSDKYNVRTLLTDTGSILGSLLLDLGVVTEISLLIHPVIVGNEAYNMFEHVQKKLQLRLVKKEFFNGDYIWVVYDVEHPNI
jgi:2,5-diamino-6-(ribosylamino)-4(3H)-pyrimidinone 5'-phosphate reductase